MTRLSLLVLTSSLFLVGCGVGQELQISGSLSGSASSADLSDSDGDSNPRVPAEGALDVPVDAGDATPQDPEVSTDDGESSGEEEPKEETPVEEEPKEEPKEETPPEEEPEEEEPEEEEACLLYTSDAADDSLR